MTVVSNDLVTVGARDGRERWRLALPAGDRRWVALGDARGEASWPILGRS